MIKSFGKKLLVVTSLLTAGFYLLRSDISAAEAASLSLTASKENPVVGESFKAIITLDTADVKTPGADVILLFDPQKLEGQEIITGKIFPQYVYKKIDNQKGQVSISGIIGLDGFPFSGQGTFAQVKFKAKDGGPTDLKFDFKPGGKNDSNVAQIGGYDDILEKAEGTTIEIKGKAKKGLDIPKLYTLSLNWLKNWLGKIIKALKDETKMI